MINKSCQRALDGFSCVPWARLIAKWYMLGHDLIPDDHDRDSDVARLKSQIEMSDLVFLVSVTLLMIVPVLLYWAAYTWPNFTWMVLVLAGGLAANVIMGIASARSRMKEMLMGAESDLLDTGRYVQGFRNLSDDSERVLNFLEARASGKECRQPSLRALTYFAYRMTYSYLDLSGRFQDAQHPQNCDEKTTNSNLSYINQKASTL